MIDFSRLGKKGPRILNFYVRPEKTTSAKDRPVDQNVKEFMMSEVTDAVTRETKPNITDYSEPKRCDAKRY